MCVKVLEGKCEFKATFVHNVGVVWCARQVCMFAYAPAWTFYFMLSIIYFSRQFFRVHISLFFYNNEMSDFAFLNSLVFGLVPS